MITVDEINKILGDNYSLDELELYRHNNVQVRACYDSLRIYEIKDYLPKYKWNIYTNIFTFKLL